LNQQRTIKAPVELAGRGLFTAVEGKVRLCPAPPNTGVVFVRTDLPKPARIRATIANLAPERQRNRRTSLRDGTVAIETIEHIMAAVNGLGIDNITIELDAEEVPGTEGSPKAFTEALLAAGFEQQPAEKKVFVIEEPISVADGDAMLAALPGESDYLDILFDLDYGPVKSIGRQVLGFRLHEDDFAEQIAPARTFLLADEAKEFQARGWGRHLTPKDLLVMGPDGPVDNELRFADEHVRHKIADLVGDLALLGRALRGRIVAYKSGHKLNHQLVRKLSEQVAAKERSAALVRPPQLDIRQIMRSGRQERLHQRAVLPGPLPRRAHHARGDDPGGHGPALRRAALTAPGTHRQGGRAAEYGPGQDAPTGPAGRPVGHRGRGTPRSHPHRPLQVPGLRRRRTGGRGGDQVHAGGRRAHLVHGPQIGQIAQTTLTTQARGSAPGRQRA